MTAQDIWNIVQAHEGKPPSRVPTIKEVIEAMEKNPQPTPPILRMIPKRVKFLSLFKHIARDLVTPESTAAEVVQINEWLGDPSGTILDLGCGWGRHTALMVREGRRVIGVDRYEPFRAEVEASGTHFIHLHFHDLADVAESTGADAAYSWQNSVFCCDPLDTLESLRGVAHVMKPGAKLLLQNTSRTIAAIPEDVTFKGVRQVTRWNDAKGCVDVTFSRGTESDSTAIYCYSRDEMRLLLDLSGFDLVRWEDDGMNALTLAVRRDDSGRLAFDEAEKVARIANDMQDARK
jgi:hypothetical protein